MYLPNCIVEHFRLWKMYVLLPCCQANLGLIHVNPKVISTVSRSNIPISTTTKHVEVTAMPNVALSLPSLSHTHTHTHVHNHTHTHTWCCLVNNEPWCIMNRFGVITSIAISSRPLYYGQLNGGNLNKLI